MNFEIATKSDATVLITGPSGSGKTKLAYQIHTQSQRARGPFISVNLATLHQGTLEAELFGYERGAFTGADVKRKGLLEQAHGGTVFLDEVSELPLQLQARLLGFLQTKKIMPLGSGKEITLDVRVIAASNKNLNTEIANGGFREDLFFRLRVHAIDLKPLRQRWNEVDQIVSGFLKEMSLKTARRIDKVSEGVMKMMEQYSWPGNIRELRNVLEAAIWAGRDDTVKVEDLPSYFKEAVAAEMKRNQGELRAPTVTSATVSQLGTLELPLSMDYYESLYRFEREYLSRALNRFSGKINLTAKNIGMNKTTFIRRLKGFNLERNVQVQLIDRRTA